jgi:hypothetical protein
MLLAKKIAAWLAVVLFAAATAVVLLQPVYPDPFRPKVGLDRFLYPTETNAFTRLPSISATLNDLHVEVGSDGQANLWAVGSGGTILHSPDGGRCWEAQGPWAPANAQAACGPRDLWDRMELIPNAAAAEAASKKASVQTSAPLALKQGQSSPEVPKWRDALRTAGHNTGKEPDDPTIYDAGMAKAVARFQLKSKVPADAIIGEQTRRLLEKLTAKSLVGNAKGTGSATAEVESTKPLPEQPEKRSSLSSPRDLSSVYFIDSQTGWVIGDAGAILKTTNGGARWDPQTSGTNQWLRAVQFLDAQTGWAVGGNGTILKTIDGGTTWKPQASGTEAWLNAVQFLDAQTGWAVGDHGTILKTPNGYYGDNLPFTLI